MIEVSISEEIANACPDLHLAVIQCEVNNSESSEKLWNEIHSLSDEIRNCCPIEEVNKFKPIMLHVKLTSVSEKIPIVIVLRPKPCGGELYADFPFTK